MLLHVYKGTYCEFNSTRLTNYIYLFTYIEFDHRNSEMQKLFAEKLKTTMLELDKSRRMLYLNLIHIHTLTHIATVYITFYTETIETLTNTNEELSASVDLLKNLDDTNQGRMHSSSS